jgi:hypothetical protein
MWEDKTIKQNKQTKPTGLTFYDLRFSKEFLHMTTKSWTTKEKINFILSNLQSFKLQRKSTKNLKDHSHTGREHV